MDLVAQMLARTGKTRDDLPPRSAAGKLVRRRGVPTSDELRRIVYGPRVEVDPEEVAELGALITEAFKTRNGTMSLLPVQTLGLSALYDFKGLFAPIRVGGGKTLLSFLAPEILECERPVLMIPGGLEHKTQVDFEELYKHWHIRMPTIVTYERLGTAANVDLLNTIRPDFIFADEGHRLKNTRAACTKRMARYMEEHPDTIVAIASGTPMTRSLMECWHLLAWCFGANMPLPRKWHLTSDWAKCIDAGIENPILPGALLALVEEFASSKERSDYHHDPIGVTRKSYGKRLASWPGVVTSGEDQVKIKLSITSTDVALDDELIGDSFQQLRERWETPDGHPFCEAWDLWRHARELACGFFYKWDPRPPEDWTDARKAWNAFVRQVLKSNNMNLDTELQVRRACARNLLERNEYDAWKELAPTFTPNNVPVWVSDRMIDFAADWMDRHPRGICWVEHRSFGQRLAEKTGRAYYGAKGIDKRTGVFIEEAPRGPVIASVYSNREGRNLQYKWSDNLVISCPPNGKVVEQMLGRTHRMNQPEEEVTVNFVLSCVEQWAGMQNVLEDSRFMQDNTGIPHKILYADVALPNASEVAKFTGPRWHK